MSLDLKKKEQCCGCTACVNICPKGCITMQEDTEGFLYPKVDLVHCVECGLCEKVCPFKSNYESDKEVKTYACANKNDKIRIDSSSGGIFSLLAETILSKKGKIFGAAFDNEGIVHHVCIDKKEGLSELRGSKYMQSYLGRCYQDIKKELLNNQTVLFVGTPCQVSGLRNYLQKDYENLICIDFFCHGVPSPKVWKKYLHYLENIVGSKVCYNKRISFRDKKDGWSKYSLSIQFENGKEYRCRFGKDLYMQTFIRNYSLRPSCYECKCKPSKEISDITIADFWGIRDVLPECFDDRGVSLAIINTKKGSLLFDTIKEKMYLHDVSYSEAVKHNSAALYSVKRPSKREYFYKNIEKKDIGYLMEYVLKDSPVTLVKNYLWNLLNLILKRT